MGRRVVLVGLIFACASCGVDEGATPDLSDAQDDVSESADAELDTALAAFPCLEEPAFEVDEILLDAYPQCSESQLTLAACGSKVNALDLGTSGVPGQGMDIDSNPETCAPVGNCSGGIDNQLSSLGLLVQGGIDEAIVQGTLILVLEYEDMPVAAGVFTLKMYAARIAPDDEECDWVADACRYRIRPDAVDERCKPLVRFVDAAVSAEGSVSAGGGEADDMILTLPVFGILLKLPVKLAQLQCTVERDAAGHVERLHGLIGGAIPSQSLFDAIGAVPADEFLSVGLSRDFILGAVQNLVIDDVDTDGDGVSDAASIAAHFDTLGATLVGWELPAPPD
jgi:hypothetical protein